jgi:hypothetical protein
MPDPSFVIGPSADPEFQARVSQIAHERHCHNDTAWAFVVDQIFTGLMEEADQAALNEIISVAAERQVRLAKPCLTFQTLPASPTAPAYPVLRFLSHEMIDLKTGEPVMITREMATTIAQSLGLIFRTDSIQVMLG